MTAGKGVRGGALHSTRRMGQHDKTTNFSKPSGAPKRPSYVDTPGSPDMQGIRSGDTSSKYTGP